MHSYRYPNDSDSETDFHDCDNINILSFCIPFEEILSVSGQVIYMCLKQKFSLKKIIRKQKFRFWRKS